jgi:hypothetical protein
MSDEDFSAACQIFKDTCLHAETTGRLYPVAPIAPTACLIDGDLMRTMTRTASPIVRIRKKPCIPGRSPRAVVDMRPHPCPGGCGKIYTPSELHPRHLCEACQYAAKKARMAAKKAASNCDLYGAVEET